MVKFGSFKTIRDFQGYLYRDFQTVARPFFDEYAKGRLQNHDLNYEIMERNLAQEPVIIPPAHDMIIFRFIFIGLY